MLDKLTLDINLHISSTVNSIVLLSFILAFVELLLKNSSIHIFFYFIYSNIAKDLYRLLLPINLYIKFIQNDCNHILVKNEEYYYPYKAIYQIQNKHLLKTKDTHHNNN